MKKLIVLGLILYSNLCFSQEWRSLAKSSSFLYEPYNQFTINPYQNQIWLVSGNSVAYINENGTINFLDEEELGELWGYEMKFAFTPTETFFFKGYDGFYKLTGDTNQLLFQDQEISNLDVSLDTIYIFRPNTTFIKYVNSQSINSYFGGFGLKTKHQFQYLDVDYPAQMINSTQLYYFFNDPDYLLAYTVDMKYSRYTDTIYCAGKKGISFAYNYDFLDTITPNNTINMPSANVLEIEFDKEDHLWAVFGDSNDKPFSIAMLENDTWVNYYDANNSPITFVNGSGENFFRGMEIDTLGNIWVCDYFKLHTLLSPTTPQWMLELEEKENSFIEVYPNPTSESLKIDFANLKGIKNIQLLDLNGKVVKEFETEKDTYYLNVNDLTKGVYLLSCLNQKSIYHSKVVKD